MDLYKIISELNDSEEIRNRLLYDLKLAEQVHRSMIPLDQQRGKLDIACAFDPMIGIGGDYASVNFQSDDHIFVTICDVSGHGMAAALLANRVNSFVSSLAGSATSPCEIVDKLNDFIYKNFGDTGLYLTFFCLFLDTEKNCLTMSGCGHPPVLLYSKQEDKVIQLTSENTIVGAFPDLLRDCQMDKTPFNTGDRILLYTDGINESRGEDSNMLGIDKLAELFHESIRYDTRPGIDYIKDYAHNFRGGKIADDDQLLLAISYLDN